MKKRPVCLYKTDGFTLIEIVISLILLAVVGSFLIQLINIAIGQSSAPIAAIKQGLELTEIMEKITADYQWVVLTDAAALQTFKQRVEDGNDPTNIPYFGTYKVTAKYINFSANGADFHEADTACTADCDTLKITISKGDQHLTALFTK